MIWESCLDRLQGELPSQQFNTWLRPLQPDWDDSAHSLRLLAPNRWVVEYVNDKYLQRIRELICEVAGGVADVSLEVGSRARRVVPAVVAPAVVVPGTGSASVAPRAAAVTAPAMAVDTVPSRVEVPAGRSGIDAAQTFESFVAGKSNEMARAASMQVADNPGRGYNPLFIYGGVGLGKTHLMHAMGNQILGNKPGARVVYLRSEDFVNHMVSAVRNKTMEEFKRYYRSLDALFIDDIQFFQNKEWSQEELFHTFNALVDGGKQIVLTSDRFPKEIEGLEERLKSRFGWGLTVQVEPPELETRVAILVRKAEQSGIVLGRDVAFFIAQKIRGHVRELEGALKRVMAHAQFRGEAITPDLAREALRDVLAMQARLVSIDNIQRTVAEYSRVKLSDLLGPARNRSLARPRQMAMALSKELTSHSLPEIGDAFGGRDHTTVLHACRKIASLRSENTDVDEDWRNLVRILSS